MEEPEEFAAKVARAASSTAPATASTTTPTVAAAPSFPPQPVPKPEPSRVELPKQATAKAGPIQEESKPEVTNLLESLVRMVGLCAGLASWLKSSVRVTVVH